MTRKHPPGILVLSLAMLPTIWAQQQSARFQHDPVVDRLTVIVQDFERRARLAGFAMTSASPVIVVDTPAQISMLTSGSNTIHTSRWEELPSSAQDVCKRCATYTGDATGEQLFADMFYRFFFVHELAHWLQLQFGMREEAKRAKPVIGGYQHHPAGGERDAAII